VAQLVGVVLVHGVLPELVPARRAPGPVRLRRALDELGGTWVKLGQTLALRFDLLPRAYCYELFGLLNEVAPFPYVEVERIIGTELGQEPTAAFASFEREPFGAASIGQVHDAVLHTGERVAVKIQRPGVRRLFATDIALMYRVAGALDLVHALGGTRSRDVIDEFARWTRDELDYTAEAANARTMRSRAREEEHDPEVHLDYTTGRVLTAERLDGILLLDVIRELRRDRAACVGRLAAAGYDLDEAASNIVWNFLNQVYAVGVFHGDLHPANLLLLPGNRIGYVDFGIIGRLPDDVRESLVRYAGCLFNGDVHDAISEYLRWVKPSAKTSLSAATEEIVSRTHRFVFDMDRSTTGRRKIVAQYQVDLLGITRAHRMTVDPVLVLYMKVVLTIDSVTSELSPSLDLQAIHVRFIRERVVEGIAQASR
jgi:ubiquinone biosynthesis protein